MVFVASLLLWLSGKSVVSVVFVGSISAGCFVSEYGGARGVLCVVGLHVAVVRRLMLLAGRIVVDPDVAG